MKNIHYMKKRARKQAILLEKIIFSLHHAIQHNTHDTALLVAEKETPLALLMKLSQILLKWHDAEMDILKHHPDNDAEQGNSVTLDEKHIEIARNYLSKML